MENTKIKTLLSNTVVFGIGNVASKLILFFLMPLYTAILTTSDYGLGEILNSSVELLFPIVTLSIVEAVFRFSIDEDDLKRQEIFSIAIKIILLGFVILTSVFAYIDKFINYEYTWYLIFMIVAYSLKMLFANFVRGIGKVKIFALNGVIASFTLVVYNLIFIAWFRWGVRGYLLSIILSNFSAAIFVFIFSQEYKYINFNAINKDLFKSMLIYSLPTIPNLLSWWVTNTSSRYIILFFCGAGLAGKFAAASKLPSMINLMSNVFQQAWQYSSSIEYGKSGSNNFYNDVFKYYSSFILTACSGLIMITPIISMFLLKGDFYDAWHYVPLLLLSATFGCYSVYFGSFYLAAKKNKMLMISTIAGAVVNIFICLLMIPKIGVYGALWASVLSYLVIIIIRIRDTKKYADIDIQIKSLILSIIILFLQSLVLTKENIYNNFISILCFVIIFIIHFNKSFKEILIYIKQILNIR